MDVKRKADYVSTHSPARGLTMALLDLDTAKAFQLTAPQGG